MGVPIDGKPHMSLSIVHPSPNIRCHGAGSLWHRWTPLQGIMAMMFGQKLGVFWVGRLNSPVNIQKAMENHESPILIDLGKTNVNRPFPIAKDEFTRG